MRVGLNYAPIRRKDQPEAARLADRLGYSSLWYGEHVALPTTSTEQAARVLAEIQGHREQAGVADTPYEFSVLTFWAPNPEQIDTYAAAGVDHLVVTPWPIADPVHALRRIEEYADEIGLAAHAA